MVFKSLLNIGCKSRSFSNKTNEPNFGLESRISTPVVVKIQLWPNSAFINDPEQFDLSEYCRPFADLGRS